MTLIAVWGASGAGKTTVALALASALVKQQKDVLLLSADSRTPALPVLLPGNTSITDTGSIGGVLELSEVTEAALKGKLHRHPKSARLHIMGYASGELPGISYKTPQRSTVVSLMQQLQQSPFQYAIVDCDANPIYDALTLFALEHARHIVRVAAPDIKSYECLKAQLAWLGNSEAFHVDRHIKVANLCLPCSPIGAASALFGGFAYTLPYATAVKERADAGELLTGFDAPEAIKFERNIAALAAELEQEEKHA